MMQSSYKPSIVISTKNRKEELRTALESCLLQSCNPEVLVFDDGSEDGTTAFVKENFPTVQVHRVEKSVGLINARTLAAGLVTGDIIFSLDDDALFSHKDIVADILKEFDKPHIGAVAIPYIDIKYSPEILQKAPDQQNDYFVHLFRGTAHALRKDLFLSLGGYRNYLVRQGEEMDYCIRLLNAGYKIKLGVSEPIIHNESPVRNENTINFYLARNSILFIIQNIPALFLLPQLLVSALNLLKKNNGYRKAIVKGIWAGLKDFILKRAIKRDPVSNATYIYYKKLSRSDANIA